MTDVEMGSMIAEQAPRMNKDMIRNLKKDLRSFLSFETNRDSKYFTLMGMPSKEGNSTRYVTLFNINRQNKKIDVTNEIYDFLIENENTLGALKGYLFQFFYSKGLYALCGWIPLDPFK